MKTNKLFIDAAEMEACQSLMTEALAALEARDLKGASAALQAILQRSDFIEQRLAAAHLLNVCEDGFANIAATLAVAYREVRHDG